MRSSIDIRKTEVEDIPRLQEIFAAARSYMAANGNPGQWDSSYPGRQLLEDDIAAGDSYVCTSEGRIIASFVLREGDDPTYAVIEGGQWLSDRPYATIHRIASSGEEGGIFERVMEFALKKHNSIRIDTHADNKIMQRLVLKYGFVHCGTIRCWNGSERLAYQYDK